MAPNYRRFWVPYFKYSYLYLLFLKPMLTVLPLRPISQQHASPHPDEPGSQHPRHPIGSLRSHSHVHRASPKTQAVFSGGIRHRPVWEPHPDRKSRASHAVHIFLCRHNDGPLRHIPAPVCGVHSHGACPNVRFPSNIAILQFCFLLWVQYSGQNTPARTY